MFLLDTNVVSALRRPDTAPGSLVSWAAGTAVTDLYLSAMTLYELELGVQLIERGPSNFSRRDGRLAVVSVAMSKAGWCGPCPREGAR